MRQGVCAETGKWLTGWDHCVSHLSTLFATRIGSVPWRRLYGAEIKELQDQNATPAAVLDFYTAAAEAIDKFEPGYRLETIKLVEGGRAGKFVFEMTGTFYPRGHLGDYSIAESQNTTIPAILLTGGRVEVAA